ncbi:MAG: iron ABC transporter permease [Thermoflexaceae bacterium]|nr:iron ABC transporter permease [Thermoflexaceae bacterium]
MDKKEKLRYPAVFLLLGVLFVAAVFANINSGSVDVSWKEIMDILLKKAGDNEISYNIIWKIRLPRLLMAAILGGALSLSGYLLQTFFRNPIAGPFVLGISSGAKMVVAAVTIFFSAVMIPMPVSATVISAFAGSVLSMLFVLVFAGRAKSMSMLLVIGVMISYISSAVTDFLINYASEADIVNLTHWSLGSFSGATWQNVRTAAMIVIPTFILTLLVTKQISAYQLGEGYAQNLGVNIRVFRVVLILLSSFFSAVVIAFAGPISFVGIAVPHIVKLMLKTARPSVMIPASFLGGAVFCMFCDLLARTLLAPAELSLGTVTSAIGAPIVIWLLLSRKESEA